MIILMHNIVYKGYWMLTNRCNLRCSYCVLEDSPDQLKAELSLENKKQLISHLYHKLNFRRLTLSGGEVFILGKNPPKEFLELLSYIKNFRFNDPLKNLEIELYTNGTYMNEDIASKMNGAVDTVAVTIDSINNEFLNNIGRNFGKYNNYFENIIKVCGLISSNNMELKLHSVIGQKNHLSLPDEVEFILNSVEKNGGKVSCWKFYQYMSYDAPEKDNFHSISMDLFNKFKETVNQRLAYKKVRLHFKDNNEMNSSLFNILSYGNAQYMRKGDSWSTTQRTSDLRLYNSMSELFSKHDIDKEQFHRFHAISYE